MVLPWRPWVPVVSAWPGPELKVVLCVVSVVADVAAASWDLRRLEPMWSFSLIFSILYVYRCARGL